VRLWWEDLAGDGDQQAGDHPRDKRGKCEADGHLAESDLDRQDVLDTPGEDGVRGREQADEDGEDGQRDEQSAEVGRQHRGATPKCFGPARGTGRRKGLARSPHDQCATAEADDRKAQQRPSHQPRAADRRDASRAQAERGQCVERDKSGVGPEGHEGRKGQRGGRDPQVQPIGPCAWATQENRRAEHRPDQQDEVHAQRRAVEEGLREKADEDGHGQEAAGRALIQSYLRERGGEAERGCSG